MLAGCFFVKNPYIWVGFSGFWVSVLRLLNLQGLVNVEPKPRTQKTQPKLNHPNQVKMKTNYWEKLEPDVVYHIYNRAVGRDNLFSNDGNYLFFLEKWKKYLPYLDVYAYCLMPNHFHFLAKVKPLTDALIKHIQEQRTVKSQQFLLEEIPYSEYLEDQFKRLFSSYALAYNKQQARHGTLFQKRFKRISVTTEYKLHYLLAYIHHNPLHHRFCSNYEEWQYSSWTAYRNLQQPSLLNRKEVLSWFDSDLDKALVLFLKFHDDFRIDREMDNWSLEED